MVKLDIASFDLFPKLHNDLKVRRSTSGALSLVAYVIMAFLLLDEVGDYITSDWVSAIGVDTRSAGGKIAINLDITFWGMNCEQFGLDVVDVTGDLQLGVENTLEKTPIGRGCNMFGSMTANRVDGEFHVAFGRLALEAPHQQEKVTPTMQHSTAHIHRFSMSELAWFNASHTVHHLSFSSEPVSPKASPRQRRMAGASTPLLFALAYPDTVDHPMDGTEKIVTHDTARFTYFIKVVPTTWLYDDGRQFKSYQLSHKEHVVPIVIGPTFRQPGVFFRYELSPYHVTNVQQTKPFGHFVASVCAIIGGVFVVVGMLTNAVTNILDKVNGSGKPKEIPMMPVAGFPPSFAPATLTPVPS